MPSANPTPASAASVTVHLLRHGQVHNPDRIVYGRLPEFHLSELGHKMAEEAAAALAQRREHGARLVYLASSPLTRTLETAAPVASALDLEVHPDERLIEPRNHFEGLHVDRGQLSKMSHWPHMINPFRPSWGEPYRQQVARMADVVVDAGRRAVEIGGDGAEAVLVSHQLPIWMARRSAEGKFLPHDPRARECNLASLTSLVFDDVNAGLRPRVVYSEPAAHLYPGVNQLPGL
ncbi:histidine phosphatase family protein [Kocuria sp. JC486]|uniref:Histidine phosphatase family protein n=1 Tax=Kocuria soli TaxID=2485125 RepID=A0A3N3ZU11_9MICC|nr:MULTISPECIES: histidine phosphatase family protein [Kocuria]NHU84655.1 histidine phosphatase family protein [Kocuria sp. JC486]ROZ65791.1 histidine phosphatase family protein [Kocuria soli]